MGHRPPTTVGVRELEFSRVTTTQPPYLHNLISMFNVLAVLALHPSSSASASSPYVHF